MSGQDGVSTRTLTALVYIVALAWAINLLAPLVIDGYTSNTGANGVMGALIGLLGAARYQVSRNKGAHSEEGGSQ
ncbi:hypothetical protein OG874_17920 [Nocardia sp. NBC_00565]|uniref:hypothetical protein n=1 Tax=Nocardia sp. NBC_00565 TaxID=2975993 RepID=UPI002E817322|nr:hypothetical protein [Nocardia sp. NBC_00565]WUC06865.1 hypothetical protein OG874_17920 [Nocardia sp. NBC_00565]